MIADIIVRAKDGHEHTSACLDSVRRHTSDHRLIMVDDGSAEPVGANDGVDIIIRCAASHGAVTATNLGLQASLAFSDSEYVVVMDNDAEVPEGDDTWLQRMVAELEQGGPETAAVGATSRRVNAPQQILATPQTYTADWENGTKANPPVIWFVSFCCLLRKSVVRECGLWDERYNPGQFEDTDYSVTLRDAGYQIRVARSVYIHHRCHSTFGDDIPQLLDENHRQFVRKWGPGRLFDLGMVSRENMRTVIGARR